MKWIFATMLFLISQFSFAAPCPTASEGQAALIEKTVEFFGSADSLVAITPYDYGMVITFSNQEVYDSATRVWPQGFSVENCPVSFEVGDVELFKRKESRKKFGQNAVEILGRKKSRKK